MPARNVSLLVVCTTVWFAGAHATQAQEATSANLPDQFQTGEMIQTQRSKKKKTESSSKTIATSPKQDTAPIPEEMPAAQETATHVAPVAEKKTELNRSNASTPPSEKPTTPIEPASLVEHPTVAAMPSEKKHRPKKQRAPVAQPETVKISAPVPVSLSVAQSMATSAPLPEYTFEMKRRNLSGHGICVVTVDSATGSVMNAIMFQSTGNPLLDKATTQTFKSWRFKPGTASEVRIPISYE